MIKLQNPVRILGRRICLKKESLNKLSEVKNYAALDYLKFICSILVVIIHTTPLIDFGTKANNYSVNFLPRIAVPLFFMISGYFVFNKLDEPAKIRKYLFKILRMYLVFSLVYLPLDIQKLISGETAVSEYLKNFFLWRSYVHLWYLIALFYTVAAVYILYSKFHLKLKTILIISGVMNLAGIILSCKYLLEKSFFSGAVNLYYDIFTDVTNALFFGFYFVLGLYLRQNNAKITKRNYWLYAAVSFLLLTAETLICQRVLQKSNCQLLVFLIPTVLFIFLAACFSSVPESMEKHSLFFRKQSTLIYLWHMAFFNFFDSAFVVLTGIRFNHLPLFALTVLSAFIFGCVWIKLSKTKVFSFLNYFC